MRILIGVAWFFGGIIGFPLVLAAGVLYLCGWIVLLSLAITAVSLLLGGVASCAMMLAILGSGTPGRPVPVRRRRADHRAGYPVKRGRLPSVPALLGVQPPGCPPPSPGLLPGKGCAMRLKSKTFLVIGGALCAFGAIFCAIILAIGQFDFMKVISVEKYEDKVYTLPAGALTALNLDAQNQRVVFQPAASSDIVIRYREFASDTYTFEQQGASLNVTYRCDQKWYQSWCRACSAASPGRAQSITVEVPPQYAGLLNARTTNASLTADSLPKLTECRLATTNGTLRVSDITADTFILSTTNAGVHLDRRRARPSLSPPPTAASTWPIWP